MLVLSRKRNEGIILLDEFGEVIARIVVTGTGYRTKIGLELPDRIRALREELELEHGEPSE